MVARFDAVSRGVKRLDGARNTKQVWRPHVRTWGLSEANLLLKKVLVTLFWLFGPPRSDSAPGELLPPCPPVVKPLAVKFVYIRPYSLNTTTAFYFATECSDVTVFIWGRVHTTVLSYVTWPLTRVGLTSCPTLDVVLYQVLRVNEQ